MWVASAIPGATEDRTCNVPGLGDAGRESVGDAAHQREKRAARTADLQRDGEQSAVRRR